MAMASILDNMDEPPKLINGRVIPVTGMIPMVMAMFSKIWNRNMPKTPTTIKAPNMVLVSLITRVRR